MSILFKIRKFLYNLFHRESLLKIENIVCYVCGNEEFLPPLDSEEEIRLLLLKEEGDVSATEKLVEHNLRLVAYIAKKFENTNIDFEDFWILECPLLGHQRISKKLVLEKWNAYPDFMIEMIGCGYYVYLVVDTAKRDS